MTEKDDMIRERDVPERKQVRVIVVTEASLLAIWLF